MSPPGPAAAPPPAPPAPRRDDEHFRNKAKHISYYAVIKSLPTRFGGRGIRTGRRPTGATDASCSRHHRSAETPLALAQHPRGAGPHSHPCSSNCAKRQVDGEALTDRRRSASTIASGTPKPLSKRSSVVRLSARSSLSGMPLKTSRVWASTAPQPPAAAPHCR